MSTADTAAGQLSRSRIESWDTLYLDEAEARWCASAVAAQSEFERQLRDVVSPGGTVWNGEAEDAAFDRAGSDLAVVRNQSDVQRAAADIASWGSERIQWARGRVLDAIAVAEDDDFRVGEDLTITDTRQVDPQTTAVRSAAIDHHAVSISRRIAELLAADAQVGQQLAAKAAELEDIQFQGEGAGDHRDPTIQLVDNPIRDEGPRELLPGPELSEARRAAVEYAEEWAGGHNPAYEVMGGGSVDCTNFVSQVMREGGFGDVGNGVDDWHHGDSNDWYYQNGGLVFPGNRFSTTWTLAKESHNFLTQHSGRGEVVGVVPTPGREGLDPLAPSKAGLLPGDLIYNKDVDGNINHVSVYVGQAIVDGVRTDVIDQHSGGNNVHNDWMPDSGEYLQAPAQVEFVHLQYPGD